jgi:uncharacterized protein
MLAFQDFQREFAQHLRDPNRTRRPTGVAQRRMAVYNELAFNNICGFVDSCFPVCRQLLGQARWRRLCRTFYRDWPSHTPWFREIPREFVRYLSEHPIAQPLPRWLAELARYEWAELAVDVMDVTPSAHDPQGDMMQARAVLNPARVDVASSWPVHRIGPAWKPRQRMPTFLVVFRDLHQAVRFVEINAVTARLLALLDSGLTGQQALVALAREMSHTQPEALQAFGQQLLHNLRDQGVLLGTPL